MSGFRYDVCFRFTHDQTSAKINEVFCQSLKDYFGDKSRELAIQPNTVMEGEEKYDVYFHAPDEYERLFISFILSYEQKSPGVIEYLSVIDNSNNTSSLFQDGEEFFMSMMGTFRKNNVEAKVFWFFQPSYNSISDIFVNGIKNNRVMKYVTI